MTTTIPVHRKSMSKPLLVRLLLIAWMLLFMVGIFIAILGSPVIGAACMISSLIPFGCYTFLLFKKHRDSKRVEG